MMSFRRQFPIALLLLLLMAPLFLSGQRVEWKKWKKLIPAVELPEQIRIAKANNNLDIIKFKGKYYLAFRTAPNHFPNRKAHLYVISSSDFKTWQFETEVFLKNDLREPRMVVHHDTLFFYFFQGGKIPIRFQPKHIWATHTTGNGDWGELRDIGLNGYVPWRVRKRGETLYMSAYYGAGIYQDDHEGDMRLFTSQDGYNWKPISRTAQVSVPAVSEGEFIFDAEGNLWATVRIESTGGLLAYADKDSLDNWHLIGVKEKYDSALLFRSKGEIYLISRRNLDGKVEKFPKWLPYALRQKYNLLRYSFTRKKTAIFHFDRQNMQIVHLRDFPSTGDTAFPGIVEEEDGSFLVLNYSSDVEEGEKNWVRGQLNKTFIYWTRLFINQAEGAVIED